MKQTITQTCHLSDKIFATITNCRTRFYFAFVLVWGPTRVQPRAPPKRQNSVCSFRCPYICKLRFAMLTLTDMGAIYFFRAVFKGHYFSPFVTWDDWIDVKYLTSQWDDYVIKDKDFNFGKFGIKWELRISLVCFTNFQNLSILIKYSLKAPGNVIYFFTKTLSLSIDVKLPPKTRHFFA